MLGFQITMVRKEKQTIYQKKTTVSSENNTGDY